MKQRAVRTFKVFAVVGALLLAASFLFSGRTVDIHLHDTYFIVAVNHLLFLIGCYLCLTGCGYWLLRNLLISPLLLWMHGGVLLPALALLMAALVLQYGPRPSVDFISYSRSQYMLQLALVAFLVAQLLFLGNVVVGVVRGTKGKGNATIG